VTLLGNQSVLVADREAAAGAGALFQADPATGAVSTVASGAPFVEPISVLAEPPTCGGRLATIIGTPGNDKITGSRFADVVAAGAGNDVVRGANNNDVICGDEGNDRINGSKGVDQLFGGDGKDRINGAPGPDLLDGGPGRDRCNGAGSKQDRAVACERAIKIP
jgi:Ca2+-binding RTX toxin-like protein